MTDIVEGLQARIEWHQKGRQFRTELADKDERLHLEAKVEIERLRAEVERYEKARAYPDENDCCVAFQADIERLQAENEKWRKYQTTAQYANDRQHAEVERLRAQIEQAYTLILSAAVFMPTWPDNQGRNDWVRSSERWLSSNQARVG